MKKMSLSRKIRLVFARVPKIDIIFYIVPAMAYISLFLTKLNDGNVSDEAATFSSSIGMFVSFMYLFTVSNCFMSLKIFRSFPMSSEDIIDISVLEIVLRAVFQSIVNSAFMLICSLPEMIPYVICMFFAMAAAAVLLVPFYFLTENMGTKPAEEDKKARKIIIISVSFLLINMALQIVISVFMVKFGFDSGDPVKDSAILGAILAVSIIILVLTAKICGKKKIRAEF